MASSIDVTIEELKERITERMDAEELLDTLEIGIEELVEAFPDKIEDNYEQLVQELFDEFGEDEEA
jgi:hypothetical protein